MENSKYNKNNKERDRYNSEMTLEDIKSFIETFQKKFNSFKTRAPVFFTFQINPLKVFIQIEGQIELIEFDIDYSKSVEGNISIIKDYLREHEYPKLTSLNFKTIEPSIHDINDLLKKEGISFSEAFLKLSKVKEKVSLLIDKIDISKNKVIVIESDDFETRYIYQVDLPVLVLLKKIKNKTSKEAYNEFMRHSELIGGKGESK